MTSDDLEAGLTMLLVEASRGGADAREVLFRRVEDDLRELAVHLFRSERAGHTLQATAVVHDAIIQLVDADLEWEGRRQFYALAARAMRRLLAGYARQRSCLKREGSHQRAALEDELPAPEGSIDLVALDQALTALEERWPRMAAIVHQRFFCGLTVEETARSLDMGVRTVEREWRFARAYLRDALGGADLPVQ